MNQVCDNCGLRLNNIICSASPDVLKILNEVKVFCRYQAGQQIFYAGNEPLGLFSVSKGLVKLEVVSETGHSHTLRIVGSSGVLGYRSLFAGETYSATAIALSDVELCFIPKTHVMQIFKDHPEVALRLLSHISRDLSQAEKKWMQQMDQAAAERVIEALLFLREQFSSQAWSRRDIAQWAGTTPETVIRTLATLEKEGLVDQSDGRQILISDMDRLKARISPQK